jgi:hypothetical protein
MSEILYELTELKGDDIRAGNYIRPSNFRIPDFCEGCPLAEGLRQPRISEVSEGLHPVNEGIRHIGPFADYKASVLVLHDEQNPDYQPVYLGEQPIVWPFSVEHESPISRALGVAQRAVSACLNPRNKKRLFRSEVTVCDSDLVKAEDYECLGTNLVIPSGSLMRESFPVVDKTTPEYMARLTESARAREAAGRSLRDRSVEEEARGIETMMVLGRRALRQRS